MTTGILSPRLRNLKETLLAAIPCAPDNEEAARDELASQSLEQVIKHYMTWVDRSISMRPRRISFASDFWSSTLSAEVVAGLAALMQLFSTGGDLAPYLSRYANTHGYVRKPEKRRKGIDWSDSGKGAKDFAVNVYDVHHLHFTPILQSRRRGPSDPLLFANVCRDHVHFLMVGNHKSFDSETLRQRVAASRRDQGLVVRTLTPAQDGAAPRDVGRLLRSGINALETLENDLVPVGMIMSDGTSLWMGEHVDAVMMTLEDWDHRLDSEAGRQELVEAMGVAADLDGAEWQFSHGDLCLVDQHGNAYLLSKWMR